MKVLKAEIERIEKIIYNHINSKQTQKKIKLVEIAISEEASVNKKSVRKYKSLLNTAKKLNTILGKKKINKRIKGWLFNGS